jgi:hypothetical protein
MSRLAKHLLTKLIPSSPKAKAQLRVESLEDRSIPSTNIPLNGTSFTPLGPAPILGTAGDQTGGLSVGGRVIQVGVHPTDPSITFVATAGGGVAQSKNATSDPNLVTWSHLTDNLTDAQVLNDTTNRNNFFGAVAVNPNNPNWVYAGQGDSTLTNFSYSGRGLLTSKDAGVTWQLQQGPGGAFNRAAFQDFVFHPTNPNIVFAIVNRSTLFSFQSARDGNFGPNAIWRSLDGGNSWDDLTSTIASSIPNFTISRSAMLTDFTLDRNNPNIGYVAVGDPAGYNLNGVYRTDGVLEPNVANVSWTVAFGGNGTFVPGSQLGNMRVQAAPSSASTIYAVIDRQGGPAGEDPLFVRSTDSGVNWTQLTAINKDVPGFFASYYSLNMLVDPLNPNRVFLAGMGTTPVVFTQDGGNSWQSLSVDAAGEKPYPAIHSMVLAPDRSLLFGTDGGVYRMTIDQATFSPTSVNWSSLNGKNTINGLTQPPGVNGASPQGALSAQNVLTVALPPGFAGEQFQDDALLMGTYLYGSTKFSDPGIQLQNPSQEYADLFDSKLTAPQTTQYGIYDFLNSNRAYQVSTVTANPLPVPLNAIATPGNSSIARSDDGGNTWTAINNGITNPGDVYDEWTAPLQLDPSNRLRLIYGTDVVNVTTDGGSNWGRGGIPNLPFVTDQPLRTAVISQLGIGRFTGSVIYAAVMGRQIPNTNPPADAGPGIYQIDLRVPTPAWLDVSPGRIGPPIMPPIPNAPVNPAFNALTGQVTDLLVDPVDSNVLYATVDTSDTSGRVWRTVNGGVTGWVDITGNLPIGSTPGVTGLRVYTITLDPRELGNSLDDEVYIGTEVGVYKLVNPTTGPFNWVRITDGSGRPLPDVMVRDLALNTTTGVLAVGTMGRGAWELQVRPYSRGFVFEDKNGNGVQDSAIIGPPAVPAETNFKAITPKVQAFDISNPNNVFESANTLTTINGFYVFRSLKDSTYEFKVQDASYNVVDPIATYQITTPPRVQTLSQTSYINNVDIGLFQRLSIGGRSFNDLNANLVQDPGEPGLSNWVMELRRSDNNTLLATTTTDANGDYTFKGVGTVLGVPFRVTEQVQPGWQVISPGAGFFDLPRVLASGDNSFASSIVFANFKLATVVGTAFEDTNGDGLLNGSEAGIPNRVVQLLNASNTVIATTTTDASGAYTFTGLTFGSYGVSQVVPAGWAITTTTPFSFNSVSGTALTGVNLGSIRPGSISGTVWEDVNGNGIRELTETTTIPGAKVVLFDPRTNTPLHTTTSDITGTYTFTNLFPLQIPGGNSVPYIARATSPTNYAQTSTPPAVILASNTASSGRDIGLFLRTTISGFAFEDVNGNGFQDPGEPPLAGGQIGLTNSINGSLIATTTADANGNFTFSGLGPLQVPSPGGPIVPYQVGGTGTGTVLTTPAPAPVTLSSGIPVGGIIIGLFRQVLFNGVVFSDNNGNGQLELPSETLVSGRTVQLVNASTNKVVANTTTNSTGTYFLAAGPGTYTIRMVSPTGTIQTTTNPGNFALISGQTVPQINFGSFQTVTISGSVFHDQNGDATRQTTEPPLSGFSVRLVNSSGQTVTATNSATDGSFSFFNVGPGAYQVLEVPPSPWRVTTANPQNLTTNSGNNVSLTFPNFLPMTVSGRVYEDLDRNGVDAGEPGLAGWTIQLFSISTGQLVGTTQTLANGSYSFTGVTPPGPLQARLVLQSGWIRTNGDSLSQPFNSGGAINFPGFGVLRLGSLSGAVFLDGNRNSVKDGFEKGLPGAVIGLFDSAGSQLSQQVTGTDGSYSFLNLSPATYTVRLLTAPGGFALSGPNAQTSFTANVTPGSTSANNNVIGLNFPVLGRKRYAVAADGGGGPRVQVYDAVSGDLLKDSFVYEVSFTGGVRVASADVNGDGVDDLVVAPGKGGGPRVRVIDGLTNAELYNFFVYEPSFRDGIYVAAGDVNGDGFDDLITGTDAGGGPRVTVYSGKDGSQIADYFAYDSSLRGGVRIGTGDINGDGIAEVLTVPGQGATAEVVTWSMSPVRVVSRFAAFDPSYIGGAYVSGGTVGVDGRSLVIVGSGANYPSDPVVRTFDGLSGTQRIETQAFFPFIDGTDYKAEVRVSSFDRNGDGVPDLVLASGAGGPSRIRFLDGRNLRQIGDELNPFETAFIGGVFIG